MEPTMIEFVEGIRNGVGIITVTLIICGCVFFYLLSAIHDTLKEIRDILKRKD